MHSHQTEAPAVYGGTATSRDIPSTTDIPARAIRIGIVAPSIRILGGQSIQAQRLMKHLQATAGVSAGFIPHNPALPAPLDRLQSIRYVRTVLNTAAYLMLLLIRVPRFDVLHVFSAAYWSYFLGPMPAILIGRLFGKKVILNYRSGELEDHLVSWGWIARWSMGKATRIITPTPYLTEVYARFGLKAEVIANYLDIAHLEYREREPLRPVFLINRLFEHLYNYPCSLEAFRKIQERVPEAELVIVGYGPLEGQIRAWIEEKKLRNVDFRGRVTRTEMDRLYRSCDIYLNSPNRDCFPSSILDAFAVGMPVVTTNAGGIRYIVEHERTGWIVECDDAAGLAEGALRMLDDPAFARRITRAAREELEQHYVWDVVGPQWDRVYRSLGG